MGDKRHVNLQVGIVRKLIEVPSNANLVDIRCLRYVACRIVQSLQAGRCDCRITARGDRSKLAKAERIPLGFGFGIRDRRDVRLEEAACLHATHLAEVRRRRDDLDMGMKVDRKRVRRRANDVTVRGWVVKDAIFGIEHRLREIDWDVKREPIACAASAYRTRIHAMVRKPCLDQAHCNVKIESWVS